MDNKYDWLKCTKSFFPSIEIAKKEPKTKDYKIVLKRYIFRWSVSVFLLGYLLSSVNMRVKDIAFFQILGNTTPAITKWANATINYDLTLLLWIYSTYSVLYITFKLVFYTSLTRVVEQPWKVFFLVRHYSYSSSFLF